MTTEAKPSNLTGPPGEDGKAEALSTGGLSGQSYQELTMILTRFDHSAKMIFLLPQRSNGETVYLYSGRQLC